MSTLSGFTLVRNAVLLDYPFVESVRSVLPLCDEFIINCGDSTDATRKLCEDLAASSKKIRIIDSVWEKENQAGGYQLKAQTDRALKECQGDWCLYIQADEAIHEADYPALLEAMERADRREEIDGVLFQYLHFYGNYSNTIRGRNWYRREVRAFKNHRGIESFRDAQGFRKNGERIQVITSSARVFHYGYVRTSQSLKQKSEQMAQWWGEKAPTSESSFQLHRHIGLEPFRETHPKTMSERIQRNAEYCDPMQCPRKWDKDEIKNAVTFVWESIVPYRIGEYRNYELKR